MTDQISRLEWERFVLGELPPDRARALEERVSRDPGLRLEIEAIERSNRDDLARYPASQIVPQIRERLRKEASRSGETDRRLRSPIRKRFFILAPALAAVVLLAVIILPSRKTGVFSPDELVKGTAGLDLSTTRLLVYRQRNQTVEELADGALSRAGDVLQLAYVATEKYGMILSIDGAGALTLQFPDKTEAAALEPKRKTLLPQAIELDDAPRFERIIFVTSDASFDGRTVWAAAAALAQNAERAEKDALTLPPGLRQVSFLIRK